MGEVATLLLEGTLVLAVALVFIGLILAALIHRSARGVSHRRTRDEAVDPADPHMFI